MLRTLTMILVIASAGWAEASSSSPATQTTVAQRALLVATEGAPVAAYTLIGPARPGDETGQEVEEGDDDDDGIGLDEEQALSASLTDGGIRYSTDFTNEELASRWANQPETLGSLSIGFTEAGRLINAVTFPPGDAWQVVDRANAWGTEEAINFTMAAALAVRSLYPDAPPLRINHVSHKAGGYLRPHRSHQAGRDVDLGFYYPGGGNPQIPARKRELAMDLALNWALLKALITQADVQFVLVDKRIQARLYAFALEQGEDRRWLQKLFHAGPQSLVRHARRHRDHFHVRFFAARSQELGRRIQPMLAKQPEQNLVVHRVKKGDTLGGLAARYRSGIKLIQKANGLTSAALRVGRTLNVPIRGACTHCPLPPPLVVPPRCLPPEPPPKS